jgi:hypothetical protein
MASPEPPPGDAEETIDAPIAANPPARLPVERLDLPIYRPRRHGVAGRFWLAVLIGGAVAIAVVLIVLT